MAKGMKCETFAHVGRSLAHVTTTKMGSPALVLITHFAAEIRLIAFLSHGREIPSSGFECHLTTDVAECI
jgi:hypothetical protein